MIKKTCVDKLRKLSELFEIAALAVESVEEPVVKDYDTVFMHLICSNLIKVILSVTKPKQSERLRVLNLLK